MIEQKMKVVAPGVGRSPPGPAAVLKRWHARSGRPNLVILSFNFFNFTILQTKKTFRKAVLYLHLSNNKLSSKPEKSDFGFLILRQEFYFTGGAGHSVLHRRVR